MYFYVWFSREQKLDTTAASSLLVWFYFRVIQFHGSSEIYVNFTEFPLKFAHAPNTRPKNWRTKHFFVLWKCMCIVYPYLFSNCISNHSWLQSKKLKNVRIPKSYDKILIHACGHISVVVKCEVFQLDIRFLYFNSPQILH